MLLADDLVETGGAQTIGQRGPSGKALRRGGGEQVIALPHPAGG